MDLPEKVCFKIKHILLNHSVQYSHLHWSFKTHSPPFLVFLVYSTVNIGHFQVFVTTVKLMSLFRMYMRLHRLASRLNITKKKKIS